MKRWAILLPALFAGTLFARELPPRPPAPEPAKAAMPSGYVFENPQLLTQQLLWGILHGVRLLGISCQTGGYAAAAEAYLDWMDRQGARLRAAERDLARHYFGQDTASPEAISAALLLKPMLDLSPDQLAAACETLPLALKKDRYDLEKYYADRRAAIDKGDPDFPGAVWVEPAPAPTATNADTPLPGVSDVEPATGTATENAMPLPLMEEKNNE